MTNRTRFLGVAFAALCAVQARAGEDELNDDVKLNVSLAEVTSFPEAYRRVPFELELLYHGPRELYNPYYTLFEPATYMNFAAWPADKPIWNRDAFVDDYPLFYVDRKNNVLERTMVALKPFTWFHARCIVKSTAQGRAWIEILSITSTNTMLDMADMRHLVRANVLASSGEFDRALFEFGMAKLAEAPPRFVARCHADQGRIALAANLPGRAMTEFQAALQTMPEDKELIALLDKANTTVAMPKAQQQVASAPTSIPPPLNLNGGPRPPNPEPKRADGTNTDANPAAVNPNPNPSPTPTPTPAPTKVAPTKTAPPAAIDPMPAKSDPKPDSAAAPKSDSTSAAKTDAPKVESKPQTDGGQTPAPSSDGTTPAAKPADAPAPKGDETKPADKPADAPDAKKDESPAPSEPKPAEAPESKPGDAPAEKPNDTPADKPSDPPADKPKPDNGG